MSENVYVVSEENKGLRLDNFVLFKDLDITRSYIKKLIDDGQILVNDKVVKAGYKVNANDKVLVKLSLENLDNILPENIPLNIVYEDDDLIVINKVQGMTVHPAGKIVSGTLVNALLYHASNLSGINGKIRPGIVHRIDKDTSGLLVVAKNDFVHLNLQKQIQEKTCSRKYLSVCCGSFSKDSGEIVNYLARGNDRYEKVYVVREGEGRLAQSLYRVINQTSAFSLVEWTLKTGRTHQIRVHSSHIGHPIVGDRLYGRESQTFGLKGQLLHAYSLSFTHPRSGEVLNFYAPLPDYFIDFVNKKNLYSSELDKLFQHS